MNYQINPEPEQLYLEPAFPDAKKPEPPSQRNPTGSPGDPKGSILKVVRAGADGEVVTTEKTIPVPMRFKEGDLVLVDARGWQPTARGGLCHQRFVVSRVVETDGEDEFAYRKGSQIALVDPATAAKMAKGHMRLDG